MEDRDHNYANHLLDPRKLRCSRSARGNLVVKVGDQEHQAVEVRRAFPLEAADRYIGFFLAEGAELGLLENPERLDAQSQQVLREELDKIYFRPIITQVHDIGEEFGVVFMEVETSRGPRRLEIRGIRTSIRPLPGYRALVEDVDGNRYELRNWHQLPRVTREILGL
jgi:hypothetical protein